MYTSWPPFLWSCGKLRVSKLYLSFGGNGWVYFHTPDDGDFRYLSIDLSQKTNIRFRVKACHDANIALSTVKGDPQHQTYEVTLGADDNTRSQIHINEVMLLLIITNNTFKNKHTCKHTCVQRRVGLVVSVSACHAVGREFASRPGHTIDHHKNGTNCLPAWHAGIRVRV